MQQILNNLDKQIVVDKFKELSAKYLENDWVKEARELRAILLNVFSKKNEDIKEFGLYDFYQECLARVNFVVLFDLDQDEIINLITKYYQLVLDSDYYDIIDKFRYKLADILDLEKRDEFKKQINQALLRNNYKISKEKIKVGSLRQDPTIANWLKDYAFKTSIEKGDSLLLSQYFSKDDNLSKLSEEDLKKVKKVISFFESNKKSSLDQGNLEESFVWRDKDNNLKIVDRGVVKDIDPDVSRIMKEIMSRSSNIEQPSPDEKEEKFNDALSEDRLVSRVMQADNKSQKKEIVIRKEEQVTKKVNKDLAANIKTLQKILDEYPLSSLEYKAVKQEINRLQSQKKYDK